MTASTDIIAHPALPGPSRAAATADADAPGVMVCHICDVLCVDRIPQRDERVCCPRCGTVLRTGRARTVDHLLAASFAALALMAAALTLPFLGLEGGGIDRQASVLDAAKAVGGVRTWPLALAVAALICGVPVLRAIALIYALLPIRMGQKLPGFGRGALRLAIELRPWSMSEVFIIGVAVALVKIGGLATVILGPAFWAFLLLAATAIFEDTAFARRTIWSMLE